MFTRGRFTSHIFRSFNFSSRVQWWKYFTSVSRAMHLIILITHTHTRYLLSPSINKESSSEVQDWLLSPLRLINFHVSLAFKNFTHVVTRTYAWCRGTQRLIKNPPHTLYALSCLPLFNLRHSIIWWSVMMYDRLYFNSRLTAEFYENLIRVNLLNKFS